jgi:hypothetical protein
MLEPGDSFTIFRREADVTRTVERLDGMYVFFSITYSKTSNNRRNLTNQKLSLDSFMDWVNKADKHQKTNETTPIP